MVAEKQGFKPTNAVRFPRHKPLLFKHQEIKTPLPVHENCRVLCSVEIQQYSKAFLLGRCEELDEILKATISIRPGKYHDKGDT